MNFGVAPVCHFVADLMYHFDYLWCCLFGSSVSFSGSHVSFFMQFGLALGFDLELKVDVWS